jgi:hypothetical protein
VPKIFRHEALPTVRTFPQRFTYHRKKIVAGLLICEGKVSTACFFETQKSRIFSSMERELAVDRAIYLVNYDKRNYRFLRRNPDWKNLSLEENRRNRASLKGFARTFRNGKTKVFKG